MYLSTATSLSEASPSVLCILFADDSDSGLVLSSFLLPLEAAVSCVMTARVVVGIALVVEVLSSLL